MKDKYLEQAKDEQWKVCIYGLGFLGKRLRNHIPQMFGLIPDYYCDSEDRKVDEARIDDSKPMYREELRALCEPVIVFVLVDDPYDIEIEEDLKENSNIYTYTLRELALMDKVICEFYGEELFDMYKKL